MRCWQQSFRWKDKEVLYGKRIAKAKIYTDLRKLYEDKDIDAVSIVTPITGIRLLQSGQCRQENMYLWKNLLFIIFFEGRKLVEAADKYELIVQDGAEQRSNPCARSMAEYLHSGKLGEVYMAKVCAINGGTL